MDQDYLVQQMSDILKRADLWYEPEDIYQMLGSPYSIELVAKAYGDSYDSPLENVFPQDDLAQLYDIAQQLNIILPDSVWYD